MNILVTLRRLKKKVDELSKSQGGGYTPPEGGVPKTDMASDVQASLAKADTAYQKPSDGIPKTDLASGVRTSLGKADTAYQKLDNGIPYNDMEGYKPLSDIFYVENSLSPGIYRTNAEYIRNADGEPLHQLYEDYGIDNQTICYLLSIKGIYTTLIYTEAGHMFYTYDGKIIAINTNKSKSPAYFINSQPIYKETFEIHYNSDDNYCYIDISNSYYSFDKTIMSASRFDDTGTNSGVRLIKLSNYIYKLEDANINPDGISYCLCEFYKSDGYGYGYGYGY